MKKIITVLIAGVVIGASVTFAATSRFSDVPVGAWYGNAIDSLVGKGIINGYSDNTFRPENKITRAELAVIIDRTLKYVDANKNSEISMESAKNIALESSCVKEGNLNGDYSYDSDGKFWRFYMKDVQKSGCGAMCIVNEVTKSADIGWMCTGLIPSTGMSTEELLKIAKNSNCAKEGTIKESAAYNYGTDMWYFEMNIVKAGCNPICVVNESNKTADINWRCTGLLPSSVQ